MYGNGTGAMTGGDRLGGYVNGRDADAMNAYQSQTKCAAPMPASREVAEQMERLEKALYFAQESLQELIARLEPITRPSAPETTGCGVAASPVSTSHGGALFGFGSRAGNLGERIQDLLRRLEI